MNELKGFIERAEVAAGSQKELGLILGMNPSNLRNAKAGQCGIPSYACVMIADMIGEETITVIAASELTTEKKANRRKVWEKKLEALAAGVMFAVVTTVVTPSPAEASNCTKLSSDTLYIMSNYGNKRKGSQEYCEPFAFWWAVQVSNLSPLPCEGSIAEFISLTE